MITTVTDDETAAQGPHPAKEWLERLLALPLRSWGDLGVLTTLSLLGVIGFEAAFGGSGYLAAGIGGLVVGVVVGLVSYALRLGALLTVAAALFAYFILGPAIVVPSQTLLGFIPTPHSWASLAVGGVYGWADILTLKTPIGAPEYISVLPFVIAWLVSLVYTILITRWLAVGSRTAGRLAVVLAGPIALYVTSTLMGTEDAFLAGIRGVSFAAIALVWVGWRKSGANAAATLRGNPLLRRKLGGTAIVVAAAVAVGAIVGTLVAPTTFNRFVLREHVQPPFDPLDFPSPLAGFRHFTKLDPDVTLFTVRGLRPGDRIRMATMDSYTGKLWNVTGPQVATDGSGSFNLVGSELPAPAAMTGERKDTFSITIKNYSDVWLPSVDYAASITFDGGDAVRSDGLRYNASTGALVLIAGVTDGMSYTLTSHRQQVPARNTLTEAVPASLTLPPVNDVPDIVKARADEFAGEESTPIGKLVAIEQALKTTGYLSHGLQSDSVSSRAGHGADRMNALLTREPMVGDQEQYASAFALMARQLGYPARVVMGFAPDVLFGSGTFEITGRDVTAWVEVAFEDVGWVAFDPTPEQTDAPQEQTTSARAEPLPQVRQPPRANPEQNNLLSPVVIDESEEESDDAFVIPDWVFAVAGVIGIPLALYFVPVVIVAALKRRRRRRRRRRGPEDRRVAGAWDELVDTYAELGYSLDRKHSRLQTAANIQDQFADQLTARERERDDLALARSRREVELEQLRGDADVSRSSRVLGSTASLVKGMTAWRPGVAAADEELPGMPELYGVAVRVDEAVFSGRTIDEVAVTATWEAVIDSTRDARRSVSWSRRQLSRFRIRSKRDWVDFLANAGGISVPRNLKGARST